MKLPDIRIVDGRLLDLSYSQFIKIIPEDIRPNVESSEQSGLAIKAYKTEWKKYEEDILAGICNVLDAEFLHLLIDAYIVSAKVTPFSHPLVINTGYIPDRFVDVLTHEIIHIILVDNTKTKELGAIQQKMFPEAIDKKSRNHVLVHAIHKAIYRDILKNESRLKRDIDFCKEKNLISYLDAWNIVETR